MKYAFPNALEDASCFAAQSHLSHLPNNFCFLFNGHPLDPSVEISLKATDVAIPNAGHYVLLVDNVHCNIEPKRFDSLILLLLVGVCVGFAACTLYGDVQTRSRHGSMAAKSCYAKVPTADPKETPERAQVKSLPDPPSKNVRSLLTAARGRWPASSP